MTRGPKVAKILPIKGSVTLTLSELTLSPAHDGEGPPTKLCLKVKDFLRHNCISLSTSHHSVLHGAYPEIF